MGHLTLTEAEAQRPSWSDPRAPKAADLRDRDNDPGVVRAEAHRLVRSLDDYPRTIPVARRLDDLIARGIVNDLAVVLVLAAWYDVEVPAKLAAVGRVDPWIGAPSVHDRALAVLADLPQAASDVCSGCGIPISEHPQTDACAIASAIAR